MKPESCKSDATGSPQVSSSEIVRRWWKVESLTEQCEIGTEHDTLEKAEWYLNKCVQKKRRPGCRVVCYTLTKAPNNEVCNRGSEN